MLHEMNVIPSLVLVVNMLNDDRFHVQPIVTDHVIVRGRYSALSVRLVGRYDKRGPSAALMQQQRLDSTTASAPIHGPAAASGKENNGRQADREVESSPPPPLFQGIKLPLGQAALQAAAVETASCSSVPSVASAPAPQPQGLVGPLPLPGLPRFVVHAMQQVRVVVVKKRTLDGLKEQRNLFYNNSYMSFYILESVVLLF